MKPINTQQLQATIDAGHTLDPTTIQQLLTAVTEYQSTPIPRDCQILPRPINPNTIRTYSQYLLEDGPGNPILDTIHRLTDDLARQAWRQGLTYDPATVELHIHEDQDRYTVRLTAVTTPKEQS